MRQPIAALARHTGVTTDETTTTTTPPARRATTAALAAILAAALLAGCASDADDGPTGAAGAAATDPASSATPDETPASPDPADEAPPFASTARRSGEGTGSGLVLVDVRVVPREGYDRVVLEFRGTGTPGWGVGYVDEAALDGSGEVVDLDGEATLDVYASGTTWPAPGYYDGPRRLTPPDGDAVAEVYVGGTFEGYTQVLVGIDGDRAPFRVATRGAPARLVVDVADAD